MDLSVIQLFEEVARLQSFTRGGESFGLSQSTVSHRIAALERELKCKLFSRRPNAALTPEGRRLLELIQPVVRRMDQVYAEFETNSPVRKRVRLAMQTISATYLFPSLCRDFIRAHRELELVVRVTDNSEETVGEVLSQRADIGLGPLPVPDSSLDCTYLGANEMVLVASPELKLGRRLTIQELSNQPFIVRDRSAWERPPLASLAARMEAPPPVALESSEMELTKRMAAIGLGVALLPTFAVKRELQSGELRCIEIEGWEFQTPFGLIYMKRRLTGPMQTFIDFCESRRGELADIVQLPAETN